MKDQDEIYEAATETPAFLGCPAHMPKTLPGGFDGTEPDGAQGGEGVPPSRIEELKKQGSKVKACNDRSYAKMVRIAELANECVLRTTHAEYAPGQYGQDYREFGKTMCEIRDLVGPGLAEKFAAKDADGTEPGVNKNKRVWKSVRWPEGCSIEMEKNGRKIVGVIQECGDYLEDETYPYRFFATVYEGTDIVFSIDSCARGLAFQRHVLKSEMNGAIMYLSHVRRYRANKRAAAKQQADDNNGEAS